MSGSVQTSKIRLATGVLVPSNRIAPVATSALASLNTLAPGRIDFGVSTGFTARRTMGLGPVKLGDMKDCIRFVPRLLAGDTLTWTFKGKQRQIRFLSPEIEPHHFLFRLSLRTSTCSHPWWRRGA
jgi:5,10-methylenetetrahydromethanopterin reductase